MEEVGVGDALPMLLDPLPTGEAGPIYPAFGFGRSLAGVWDPTSLSFYAEASASGRELRSSHGQDVNQLAGNVILDAEGKVAWIHHQAGNTDRPSVEEQLEVCRRLASEAAAASARSGGRAASPQSTAASVPPLAPVAPAVSSVFRSQPLRWIEEALRARPRAAAAASAVAAVVAIALWRAWLRGRRRALKKALQ